MSIELKIDPDQLSEVLENIKDEVENKVHKSAEKIARGIHENITNSVNSELDSIKDIYLSNLKFEKVGDNTFVVSLDDPAMWIERGRKDGFMEELLKNNAKMSKDGNRYKAIPIKDTGESRAESLKDDIKDALAAKDKQLNKVEFDEKGSPRVGKLDTIKSAKGQTNVYQTPTKKGTQQQVVIFRTISDKHKGSKWHHPGYTGKNYFDKAIRWAEEEFETRILPSLGENNEF